MVINGLEGFECRLSLWAVLIVLGSEQSHEDLELPSSSFSGRTDKVSDLSRYYNELGRWRHNVCRVFCANPDSYLKRYTSDNGSNANECTMSSTFRMKWCRYQRCLEKVLLVGDYE